LARRRGVCLAARSADRGPRWRVHEWSLHVVQGAVARRQARHRDPSGLLRAPCGRRCRRRRRHAGPNPVLREGGRCRDRRPDRATGCWPHRGAGRTETGPHRHGQGRGQDVAGRCDYGRRLHRGLSSRGSRVQGRSFRWLPAPGRRADRYRDRFSLGPRHDLDERGQTRGVLRDGERRSGRSGARRIDHCRGHQGGARPGEARHRPHHRPGPGLVEEGVPRNRSGCRVHRGHGACECVRPGRHSRFGGREDAGFWPGQPHMGIARVVDLGRRARRLGHVLQGAVRHL